MTAEAVWQDVEFGAYAADLPLWDELAAAAKGPLLELGAGGGRVTLHLLAKGHPVFALDRDGEMCAELERRAQDMLDENGWFSTARIDFDELSRRDALVPGTAPFGLAIAPLHVIQQVEPASRPGLLSWLAKRLSGGGVLAATLVDESSILTDGRPAVPDMREIEGWVISSEPLWVQVGEETLRVRRMRQRVSPAGEIERGVHDELLHRISPEELEAEAGEAGFVPRERRPITSGSDEADSIAVVLEAT
ncbi:hypothetical protein BH20ACT15_BH20ACT15_08660 [soil metagenome]